MLESTNKNYFHRFDKIQSYTSLTPLLDSKTLNPQSFFFLHPQNNFSIFPDTISCLSL